MFLLKIVFFSSKWTFDFCWLITKTVCIAQVIKSVRPNNLSPCSTPDIISSTAPPAARPALCTLPAFGKTNILAQVILFIFEQVLLFLKHQKTAHTICSLSCIVAVSWNRQLMGSVSRLIYLVVLSAVWTILLKWILVYCQYYSVVIIKFWCNLFYRMLRLGPIVSTVCFSWHRSGSFGALGTLNADSINIWLVDKLNAPF